MFIPPKSTPLTGVINSLKIRCGGIEKYARIRGGIQRR